MGLTPPTPDVRLIELPTQLGDVGGEVADDGGVLEEVVALGFAAPAVEGFVAEVRVVPVGVLAGGGHRAGGHAVEVLEAGGEGCAGEEVGGATGARVWGWGGRLGLCAGWGCGGWWVSGGHCEIGIEKEANVSLRAAYCADDLLDRVDRFEATIEAFSKGKLIGRG